MGWGVTSSSVPLPGLWLSKGRMCLGGGWRRGRWKSWKEYQNRPQGWVEDTRGRDVVPPLRVGRAAQQHTLQPGCAPPNVLPCRGGGRARHLSWGRSGSARGWFRVKSLGFGVG